MANGETLLLSHTCTGDHTPAATAALNAIATSVARESLPLTTKGAVVSLSRIELADRTIFEVTVTGWRKSK
jgi:hypothetical protein